MSVVISGAREIIRGDLFVRFWTVTGVDVAWKWLYVVDSLDWLCCITHIKRRQPQYSRHKERVAEAIDNLSLFYRTISVNNGIRCSKTYLLIYGTNSAENARHFPGSRSSIDYPIFKINFALNHFIFSPRLPLRRALCSAVPIEAFSALPFVSSWKKFNRGNTSFAAPKMNQTDSCLRDFGSQSIQLCSPLLLGEIASARIVRNSINSKISNEVCAAEAVNFRQR